MVDLFIYYYNNVPMKCLPDNDLANVIAFV